MLTFAALMRDATSSSLAALCDPLQRPAGPWWPQALASSSTSVVRRIQRQRARGDSLRKIADDLNASEVPTAQGGAQWYAATVRHVLLRTS